MSFWCLSIISGVTIPSEWKVNRLSMNTLSRWSISSTIRELLSVVWWDCLEAVSLWFEMSMELLLWRFIYYNYCLCFVRMAIARLFTSSSFGILLKIFSLRTSSSAWGRNSLALATRSSFTVSGACTYPWSMQWKIPLFENISLITFSITVSRSGKTSNVRLTNLEKFWHCLENSDTWSNWCPLWLIFDASESL